MSVLAQILLVFALCLLAEGAAAVLPIAVPAGVLSMVFLLLLLAAKAVKGTQLTQINQFFSENMALFFVPAGVSVLQYADVLLQNFWAVVLISLLTTPVVFFVTGQVVQLTMKLLQKKEEA